MPSAQWGSWNQTPITENLHAPDEICDGFRDGVVTSTGVALAAFIQELHKLGREPAPQTIELPNPAVLVFLRYDLKNKRKKMYEHNLTLSDACVGDLTP